MRSLETSLGSEEIEIRKSKENLPDRIRWKPERRRSGMTRTSLARSMLSEFKLPRKLRSLEALPAWVTEACCLGRLQCWRVYRGGFNRETSRCLSDEVEMTAVWTQSLRTVVVRKI